MVVHLIRWKPDLILPYTEYLSKTNLLILLDNAEETYLDNLLWKSLIRPASNGRFGPMIALFGSYGSALDNSMLFKDVPMEFGPNQRMSLRPLSSNDFGLSILFTRSEFEDCIARIVKQPSLCRQPFLPCNEFVEQLWVMTNGHPGVIKELMHILMGAEVCLINESLLWPL